MPRTVDVIAHARRRNEFLDSAQRLLVTKGYERLTIQDVLDNLGTSKGALYHYFDSKQALLEGIVQRASDIAEESLTRLVADTELTALQKLSQFFGQMAQWKVERRELLLEMLPLWVSDDNAVFRQKMNATLTERMTPLLTGVVEQGAREGVFTTRFSDQVGRAVMVLLTDCHQVVVQMLLASQRGNVDHSAVEQTFAAYTDLLERVLGAPRGSLVLVEVSSLRLWFDSPGLARHRVDEDSEENRNEGVH